MTARRAGARRIRVQIAVAGLGAAAAVLTATLPVVLSQRGTPGPEPAQVSPPQARVSSPPPQPSGQNQNSGGVNIGGDQSGSIVVNNNAPASPGPEELAAAELFKTTSCLQAKVATVSRQQGLGVTIDAFGGLLNEAQAALNRRDFSAARRLLGQAAERGAVVLVQDRQRTLCTGALAGAQRARTGATSASAGRWWPQEFSRADHDLDAAQAAFDAGHIQRAMELCGGSGGAFEALWARGRMVVRAESGSVEIAVPVTQQAKDSLELVRLKSQARETASRVANEVIGRMEAEGARTAFGTAEGQMVSFRQERSGDWTMVWRFVSSDTPARP